MMTQQQRLAGLAPALAPRVTQIARHLDEGRVDIAERDLIAALALAPAHPEILRLLGLIQRRRGQYRLAIETLSQAAAQRPDDATIHNALAGAYEAVGESDRARSALARACELAPDWAPCWFNYGYRLFVDGNVEAALPVLRHAVSLAPKDAQARTLLADALNAEGDSEQAASHYRKIIASHPFAAGSAWWGLATLRPMPLDARDVKILREALRSPKVPDADRVTMAFALALALEHQGDYGDAFEAMRDGHARARRAEPYDGKAFTHHVDAVLAAFSSPPVVDDADGNEIIFVVSLPRSGSTLAEQILGSHSHVGGGAELPDLSQVVLEESDRAQQKFPQWVPACTPEKWRALGERYLARTAHWRANAPRSIDKNPGNWLYGGALLAMLPRARIVVVRRDPLETCLGCYRYMFRRHPYTHDFADLAARWRDFDRAVEQWQKQSPGRVRIQSYEALVADPETEIRALLDFCGLPFEEGCLNFHASERRVLTPSAAQVREPLRKDTARADKYGKLIDPLRIALGLPTFAA